MTDALAQLWRTLATTAPKAALFLAILAVGYVVARVISSAITRLLLRAGFNRVTEKAGLNKMMGGSYPNVLVGKLAFFSVLLIVLQLAFGVFGPNPISTLITSVIAFLPRLAVAIALVVVAGVIASKVRDLIVAAIGGLSYAGVLATAAKVFVIALGVIAALSQVGVALTVTMPVLIAVLATVAGILIVGAGGGLIKPAQARWERLLEAAEAEATTTRTLTVERTTVE